MNETPMLTRRNFLQKGLTLFGASATVPAFIDKTAWAIGRPDDVLATSSQAGVPEDRILVIVQLAGGNDGLNTVIPYTNDFYHEYRPRLRIAPENVLAIDDELGFHPAMSGFKSLYDEGMLGIVQGVGYPNQSRSHFQGVKNWESADPEGQTTEGWIGRFFDHSCSGLGDCTPDAAVALTSETPPMLRGRNFEPLAMRDPDANLWYGGSEHGQQAVFDLMNDPEFAPNPGDSPELTYLRRVALDARLSAEAIRDAARNGANSIDYPGNSFARSLRTVARMIAAELPTRIYYVSLGGFDTHSSQSWRHQNQLGQLAGGLRAFISDLSNLGHLDRTLVMTFSEFGRRVQENASAGTDHGEAAPMFLLGSNIHPGIHGEHPPLDALHRGDLAYQIDFREVYASVLQDWMQFEVPAIMGEEIAPQPLLPPADPSEIVQSNYDPDNPPPDFAAVRSWNLF